MFDPVSIVWAAIGISIAALVVVRTWLRYHAPRDSSLGTVSEQWLTEQRNNRPDSHR